MIPEFNSLSSTEIELMHKAPVMVCILVAGADGHVDQSEIAKAITFATKRAGKSKLVNYYKEVGNDFEDKIKIVMMGFPAKEKERAPKIIAELSHLNDILRKLDKGFIVEFFKSLKDVALEIAQSSGGVLGLMSVGEEEARYLALDMINDPSTF